MIRPLLAAALSVAFGAGTALAQDTAKPAAKPTAKPAGQPATGVKPASAPAEQPDEHEMMKMWLKANEPGPMHELLMRSVGTWQAQVKSWMQPGVPPTESTGTAVVTSAQHGRFTYTEYAGSFGPLPFTGTGYYGYNNATKQFESVWIDSMSTGMLLMTGAYDASKKEMTWTGSMVDPMDGKKKTIRSVETFADDNNFVMAMYGPGPDGKEFKTMEIQYTRTGGIKPAPDRNVKPLPAEKVAPAKK